MKVVIHGALGAMGRVLTDVMGESHQLLLVESHQPTSSVLSSLSDVTSADVVIDFSHPSLLPGVLEFCVNKKIPLVLGTTNLSSQDQALIDQAAQAIPVMESPNFSYGVAVMRRLIKEATRVLEGFDIEVTETHHVHKKDAPSGTAKQLLADIQASAHQPLSVVQGRGEQSPAKAKHEIGVHSIRSGSNPGEHTVIYSSSEEQIEVTHKAFSRRVFAMGAKRAAEWVVSQPAGRYSMEEMMS
jgi:4-hydroxy-tetrahydrodipicolinate reductase